MIKLLGTTGFLALALAASPASAQLLGGGGGLGGGLGGSLGGLGGSGMGTLGGSIDSSMRRLPSSSDTIGSVRGSTRTEKNVDARRGHVRASNESSLDSTVTDSTRVGDRAIGGSGSASGRAGGSADAQLIGTDAVRGTAGNALDRTRNAASNARDRAGNAIGGARDAAGNAVSRARNAVPASADIAGTASGAASGAGSLGGGTLALAGSAAANGSGSFPVSLGMPVRDAKGRLIGTVESVRSTGRGAVQQVLVKVGDRTATLPAANFSGSGNALVSAMGKGEVKKAAE